MIREKDNVTLTESRQGVPAGATGHVRDDQTTPYSWREPAVWVFWDDKAHYPRWVPVRLLAVSK